MVGSVRDACAVLPAGGVLLHVGPHKTGTTALQLALAAARTRLLEVGIVYPGDREDHNWPAAAVIGRALGWDGRRLATAHWSDLAYTVRQNRARRVVLSGETFCEASPSVIPQVLDDLGRDRVHVVLTLRPLEQLLASSWQQYVKSGYPTTYGEWLEDVLRSRERTPGTPSFWTRQHHGALINRWLTAIDDPRRLTVVVSQPRRPEAIFDAFEAMLTLPPGFLTAGGSENANRSLTAVEADLLRTVNSAARQRGVSSAAYDRLLKRGAVRALLIGRAPPADEPRISTPPWAIERAREFATSDVTRIRASGVRVVGDLDALAPTGTPTAATTTGTPTAPTSTAQTASAVPTELAATLVADLLVRASAVSAQPRAMTPGRALRGLRRRVGRRLRRDTRPGTDRT